MTEFTVGKRRLDFRSAIRIARLTRHTCTQAISPA